MIKEGRLARCAFAQLTLDRVVGELPPVEEIHPAAVEGVCAFFLHGIAPYAREAKPSGCWICELAAFSAEHGSVEYLAAVVGIRELLAGLLEIAPDLIGEALRELGAPTTAEEYAQIGRVILGWTAATVITVFDSYGIATQASLPALLEPWGEEAIDRGLLIELVQRQRAALLGLAAEVAAEVVADAPGEAPSLGGIFLSPGGKA